jgi:replicative DNA helicase
VLSQIKFKINKKFKNEVKFMTRKSIGKKLLETFSNPTKNLHNPTYKECSLIDRDFIKNYFKDLKKFVEKGYKSGITTGFKDLDSLTGGLKQGQLIVIGSRPTMGKTALALNIALRSAIYNSSTVAIFSLELTKKEVLTRLISSHSKVDISKFCMKKGKLNSKDWLKITKKSEEIGKAKIFIDDTAGLVPSEIREKARRIKSKYKKLDLIIIDYLQLMKIRRGKVQNREQEMAEISRALKNIAEELEVPVIVLSKLSREIEIRSEDKRPRLSDIIYIVPDADMIMFLYRNEVYYPNDISTAGLAEIIINQNRGGPTGTTELVWYRPTLSFEDKVLNK